MNEREWKEFKVGIVDEEQELSFSYKSEEWWISRLYGEEKSYLSMGLLMGKSLLREYQI